MAADILDVRKSLLIAFLAISDRSAILDVWNSLSIAILAISDRYNYFFSAAILDIWKSLSIAFLAISDRSAILDVRNSLLMAFRWHFWTFFFHLFLNFWQNVRRRPFWVFENNFWSLFWRFQIDTQLVRDIWMNSTCVKFKERSLNPSKVIALKMKLWRGGCVADENIHVADKFGRLSILH